MTIFLKSAMYLIVIVTKLQCGSVILYMLHCLITATNATICRGRIARLHWRYHRSALHRLHREWAHVRIENIFKSRTNTRSETSTRLLIVLKILDICLLVRRNLKKTGLFSKSYCKITSNICTYITSCFVWTYAEF